MYKLPLLTLPCGYRTPSSVPVRSGGNSRNGERNGGVPFSISGTGTASSVPYAVPDGPGRPKLPKKATVPGFGAPRTARPFQIRNSRNGNGERPFRWTRPGYPSEIGVVVIVLLLYYVIHATAIYWCAPYSRCPHQKMAVSSSPS